jgi:hypothetical protein
MGRWQVGLYAAIVILLGVTWMNDAVAQNPQKDWAVTLYFGRLTDSDLTNTFAFNSKFENSYFVDLGVSRRLFTYKDYFNIEIEGQIAKHFGDQDNWEFNLVSYFLR